MMTDEQINIAIAEACGWTNLKLLTTGLRGVRPTDGTTATAPNYANDLNAMHEAEKMLYRGIDQQKYWQTGYGRFKAILGELYTEPFSATARQRAEAFLKTLNLDTHP